ncbi:MAG: DUF2125 domain-containing protein [Silicimonas sp.]|nr:DUF2125 domain-containing protein [Silicimonas sp.]
MFRYTAPALCLLATPAFADLTAEEVLADHLNMLSGYGLLEMETTGTRMSADGLVVEGFTGIFEGEGDSARITTPGMVLTEEAGGAVTITYGDRLPITVTSNPGAEDEIRITAILTPEGLSHRVSGHAEDLTHEIRFDGLTLGEVSISPPEAAETLKLSGDLHLTGLEALLRYRDDGTVRREVEIALAGLTQGFSALMDTSLNVDLNGTRRQVDGKGQIDGAMTLADLRLKSAYETGAPGHHGLSLNIGEMTLSQRADMEREGRMDGTARMEDLALSYDLRMSFEGWQEDPEAAFDGVESARADFSLGRLNYDLDMDLQENADIAQEPVQMETASALSDLAFGITYEGGDVMRHGARLSLGALNGSITADMAEDDAMAGRFDLGALGLTYDLALSPEEWEADLLAALSRGQSIAGAFTLDRASYDFDFDTPDGAMKMATRSGAAETRFSFDQTGVTLYSATRDLDTRISGPAVAPLGVDGIGYRLTNFLIDLALPVTPGEAAQPFHARLGLDGLAMEDGIWDLFDPGAKLPRIPARLAFDLKGKAEIKSDPFGPQAEAEEVFGATEMRLNRLALDVAGVTLDGSGALSGVLTPEAPVADGTLDLTMTGLHEALDILIELGFLAEADAMGARMMLGLFARPGERQGELVSEIEMNKAGEIYANGQRIK